MACLGKLSGTTFFDGMTPFYLGRSISKGLMNRKGLNLGISIKVQKFPSGGQTLASHIDLSGANRKLEFHAKEFHSFLLYNL